MTGFLLETQKHSINISSVFTFLIFTVKSYTYIVNWTSNFLSRRQERVKSDGNMTPFLLINKGVPQGTILGKV